MASGGRHLLLLRVCVVAEEGKSEDEKEWEQN
jgi:hypothetical protein